MKRLLFLLLIISACRQQIKKKENTKNSTQVDSINKKKIIFQNEVKEEKGLLLDSIKNTSLIFSNGLSLDRIELIQPTVIIVQLDSIEIAQVKLIDGEDNFYTASDDLMWYNSMLLEKMDSLNITVKYSDKDTIKIYSANFERTIIKDSTFSLYTYFYFDGKKINKKELFELIEEDIIEKQLDSTEIIAKKIAQAQKRVITDWKHPDYFEFEDYKEYKISDTIHIDLNGNGILEQIYFEDKDCSRLLITEKGEKTISIGCGKEDYVGFPNAIGWVDLWCVVSDKQTFEVIIKDGDILGDETVYLERPSLYVGKEEAGGGIITYKNGKLYWVHQSD